MSLGAEARIDLAALTHNLRRVRAYAPQSRVAAVVKANGYGHGLVRVAKALSQAGTDAFAVASLDEAVALRHAGMSQPILLLEGIFHPDDATLAARYQLTAVVHHPVQLELLAAFQGGPLQVCLKVDTGMHRLGFRPEDTVEVWQRLSRSPAVAGPIMLMTHLANADTPDDSATTRQVRCFAEAVAALPGPRCIANSGGVLAWPESHGDWVRPGIMLYGVSPFGDGVGAAHALEPAMTLRSQLIAVNHFKRGEPIGYGGTWSCPQDMPVGVAAVGYGDGYPRHARVNTPVLVNGQRHPLVGRVSMDMITIDLRDQPAAQVGDPVTLWGEGLPVEEIAKAAETIPYHLLCSITQRVRVVDA